MYIIIDDDPQNFFKKGVRSRDP